MTGPERIPVSWRHFTSWRLSLIHIYHYYGTPKEYVLSQMEQGKDVLLEIEIQGALKVKERFPEAILIFVMPPNAEELKRRLIGRGTESRCV